MIKKRCLEWMLFLFLAANYSVAKALDPVLASEQEQARQRQIEAQEQLRRQELLKSLRERQEIQPNVKDDLEILKEKAFNSSIEIPENETPCFVLHQIQLTGEDADHFEFALAEGLSVKNQGLDDLGHEKILGRCFGVQGINALISRIQNAMIAKGFITTRVLAAPQDLKSGVLQLTVIAGRIGNIVLTPDSNRYISPWLALPLHSGEILNLRHIEHGLENLKRVPTADANLQIAPSHTNQPGYSDIAIQYKQKFPIRVSLGVDDSGLNSTGRYMGYTTLSADNLLALSDLFYVSHHHDLGGGEPGRRGAKGYAAHYSIPIQHWLFSATTSSNDYYQQVAGASQHYLYSGKSQNSEIKVSRLLYRNSIHKTHLSLRGFLRKSFNYIDDTEIEVQRRRTAGWELGFSQSWYLGAAILDYNLAYRRGTGALDAMKAPEEGFDEGTSRMKMLMGELNLMVPFGVNAPWGRQSMQCSAYLRGQTNYTPLTPQDRFSIGNRFTVRGFDGQQTLIADSGWLVRNELSAAIGASGQSIYWGLDYGEVGGQSSEYLIGKYLAGTVLGMRGGLVSDRFGSFSYDMFVGKPINKPQGYQTHDAVAGFSFNFTY